MNIFVAGIGSGNYELITLSAIEHAKCSDVIIVPRSKPDTIGMSEKVIMHIIKDKTIIPVHFPMIKSETNIEVIEVIYEQLIMHDWTNINSIFFPVIGDVMLYSTAEYLIEAFRKMDLNINVEFIPGISAHSVASSIAKRFLAMRDEIFCVVSGTADPDRIIKAMRASDVIAVYKPRAIKNLRELVKTAGDFRKIIRVDYAGIPERESINEGIESLDEIHEYMSIVILWK